MGDIGGGLWTLAQALVVLVIGVALVAGGWTSYQGAQDATANAVQTEGTVVASVVEETEIQNAEGSGTHTEYLPEIEYRYTYDGETYTSTSICPGAAEGCDASNADPDRQTVERFLEQYPEGETVSVYVVWGDPDRSFLVDTESGYTAYYVLMGIGGLALFGGLVGLAAATKKFAVG